MKAKRDAVPARTQHTAGDHHSTGGVPSAWASQVHRSSRMVAQRQMLNTIFGPAIQCKAQAGENDVSAAQAPLQRVVDIKGTGVRGAATAAATDSPGLRAMKTDAGRHLLLSLADYDQLSRGDPRGVRRLTPHRHLIGEAHAQSRFNEAVADWGFGAQQMREALSTHSRLHHVAGDEARANPSSEHYRASPLEDTAAKNLASLAGARSVLNALRVPAAAYAGLGWGQADADAKDAVARLCEDGVSDLRTVGDVIDNLTDYVKRAPSAFSRFRFVGKSDPAWAQVDEISALIASDDFGDTMDNASRQVEAQAVRPPTALHLHDGTLARAIRYVDRLIDAIAAIVAQVDATTHASQGVAAAVVDAKRDEGVDAFNDLREHYMARNIASLPVPGLVKIGAHHLAGLQGKGLTDTVFHNDYAAFLASTRLETGNFWDADLKRGVDFDTALGRLEGAIGAGDREALQPFLTTMRQAWVAMTAEQRDARRLRTMAAVDRYFVEVLRRRPSQVVQAEELGFPELAR